MRNGAKLDDSDSPTHSAALLWQLVLPLLLSEKRNSYDTPPRGVCSTSKEPRARKNFSKLRSCDFSAYNTGKCLRRDDTLIAVITVFS